ncbi:AAA family ATPase [Dankookia rubra]|uniref:AAA family ATPase n=1 Tax=Dankookia rubra TaxID=1442381 RepID=A0A4R5QIT3_9PROT|nr:AAA family ATPase [Dankookia rubra]TDH63310.1 AAA family ATPase [Dankookia rubra]
MRLDLFKIDGFKNLRNVEINFDEDEFATVLIGLNGAGKSNILEALVTVFRALDLGNSISFRFFLRYHCRAKWIELDNRWTDLTSPQISIVIKEGHPESPKPAEQIGTSIRLNAFRKRAPEFLPNHVFGYYSGQSDRFEKLFDKHQSLYYSKVIKPGAELELNTRDPELRRLFYCRHFYGQLALLSYFAFDNRRARQLLREHMGITGLHSALIVMKEPWWAKGRKGQKRPSPTLVKHGDPNFWFAYGVVRRLLDKLWAYATAPIRIEQSVQTDYRGNATSEEHVYLFIKDEETLGKLAGGFDDAKSFFAMLETLDISDLVREVRLWVHREGADAELPFHEISDGEKQLLTVLGLMEFTRHDESLFLLDEPDTHLNPAWKWKYLELAHQFSSDETDDPNGWRTDPTSHIVMTSHDPLTMASLQRQQVQVMSRDDFGRVSVQRPPIDPRGLGVAGILTDIFGLSTTLDPITQRKLDERNALFSLADSVRSPAQEDRMEELSRELAQIGLRRVSRDPLYDLFLKRMAHVRTADTPLQSPADLEAMNALADQVIKELSAGTQP